MDKIIIVGCGPGSADYITQIAYTEVARAELFIAPRHLHPLFNTGAERTVVGNDIENILKMIAENRHRHIVVGVSGDPGIASLAKNIVQRFGADQCHIIPGISSVTVAFARLGIDWTDTRIVNTHSGFPHVDRSIADASVVALLAGTATMEWIRALYAINPEARTIFICENLTLDDERIRKIERVDEIPADLSSRTILILLKKATK